MTDILSDIQSQLNLSSDDFNGELLADINGAIVMLTEATSAVSPLLITGHEETWSDLLGDQELTLRGLVQLYIFLFTRILFDPPETSYLVSALSEVRDDALWRIREAALIFETTS